MLSRIAESLFWIGRYIERADDTARLLDVHVQLLLEDPWAEEDLACRSLLSVMDREVPPARSGIGREDVLAWLAYDSDEPSSVVGSLGAARGSARRVREIISTELWESLNSTWTQCPARVGADRSHDFFAWVRERAAVLAGIADTAMSRDETWHFMVLGRSIERADMTARLLMTRALAGTAGPSWVDLLRSCGAYEAFLRTFHGSMSDQLAAEFLLTHRLFPRSIAAALHQAEECLSSLDPVADRASQDEARRFVGHARASLEYRPLVEILGDLPHEMEMVQRACSGASDAVRMRYFPSALVTSWVGGAL